MSMTFDDAMSLFREYHPGKPDPSSPAPLAPLQEEKGVDRTAHMQAPAMTTDDFINSSVVNVHKAGMVEKAKDSSFGANFAKGFASTPTIMGNLAKSRITSAENVDSYRVLHYQDADGNLGLQFSSVKEVYGDDFSSLSPEQRGIRIKEVDSEMIREKYGNVGDNFTGNIAGSITSIASDPTTWLIPVGGSVKAAGAIGAAVGGIDQALETKLAKGEVDPGSVVLGATIGGAGGAIMYKGGKSVSNYLSGKSMTKVESSPEKLRAAMIADGVPEEQLPNNMEEITDQFNKAIGAGQEQSVQQVRMAVGKLGESVPDYSPMQMSRIISDIKTTYGDKLPKKDAKFLDDSQQMYNRIASGKEPKPRGKLNKDGKFVQKRGKLDKRFQEIEKESWARAQSKVDADVLKQVEDIVNKTPIDKKTGTVDNNVLRGWGMEDVNGARAEADVVKYLREGTILENSNLGQELSPRLGRLSDIASVVNQQTQAKAYNLGKIKSFITTPATLMKKFGASGSELVRRVELYRAEVNRAYSRTTHELAKAKKAFGLSSKLSQENKAILTELLEGARAPKDAPESVIKLARTYRSIYENAVKDAAKHGVYTPKQAADLITNAREVGYSPRQWDFDYMDTTKGKKAFMSMLETEEFTQKEASALLGMFYKGKKLKDAYKGLTRVSSGNYKVTGQAAKDLYAARRQINVGKKSSHLEKQRKLDLPYAKVKDFLVTDPEQLLSNYIKDSYSAMMSRKYFGRTADDAEDALTDAPIINELVRSIRATQGDAAEKEAREFYLGATNNFQSETLSNFRALNSTEREVITSIKSYESMKLVLAQILNLSQAAVNSFVKLTPSMGMRKALTTSWKGIKNTFNKEGREFAERSGAAAQTTLMHIMGENAGSTSNLATKLLDYSGFQLVENYQRLFAANIGKSMIEAKEAGIQKLMMQQAKRGLSPKETKELKSLFKDLEEFDIMPEHVGKLTVAQKELAGSIFSDTVNFIPDSRHIPRALQGPYMALIRQFKSFAILQTRLMKNAVVEGYERDGYLGATKVLAAIGGSPVAAGGIPVAAGPLRGWIKDFAAGKDTSERNKDKNPLDYYVEGLANVGAMGIYFDFAASAYNRGSSSAALNLGGPAAGDAVALMEGFMASAKNVQEGTERPFKPVGVAAARTLPLGNSIATWVGR